MATAGLEKSIILMWMDRFTKIRIVETRNKIRRLGTAMEYFLIHKTLIYCSRSGTHCKWNIFHRML